MNPIEEQTYHLAWLEVNKLLEDVTIDNQWSLKMRLEKIGIMNYPMSEEILLKLNNNKQKYEQLRESRRNLERYSWL